MNDKTDNKLCLLLTFVAVAVIAYSAGILTMIGYTRMDDDLIRRCQQQVAAADELDEEARRCFDELRAVCPDANTRWKIVKAVAGVKNTENTP